MPQIIDYAGRFEQTREAVCTLVLREGAQAVRMDRVAAEMAVSRSTLSRVLAHADALPWLGREFVDRQDRTRRLVHGPRHQRDQPAWRAWYDELAWLLPLDETRARHAVVRFRLSEAFGHGDPRLREADASRTEALDDLVRALVVALKVPADDSDEVWLHLRALVDGLVARVCRGQLPPDDARTVLSAYVGRLARGDRRRVA
jgi:hypothetical protein